MGVGGSGGEFFETTPRPPTPEYPARASQRKSWRDDGRWEGQGIHWSAPFYEYPSLPPPSLQVNIHTMETKGITCADEASLNSGF